MTIHIKILSTSDKTLATVIRLVSRTTYTTEEMTTLLRRRSRAGTKLQISEDTGNITAWLINTDDNLAYHSEFKHVPTRKAIKLLRDLKACKTQ